MKATLAALIFDVDGTLAETEELHRESFNEAFAASGLPWSWDRALYAQLLEVAGGKERIRHFITSHGGTPTLKAEAIAALHRDKTARYTARLAGTVALRPGVADLLWQARAAGLRLAIATTTSRPNIDALLAAAGSLPAFDVIAAGDEVPNKKPAPDIYIAALERLNLPAASCLAVEDTLNGLKSAQGASLACVMTRSHYGGDGPFPGALAVLDDLSSTSLADLQSWFASSRRV